MGREDDLCAARVEVRVLEEFDERRGERGVQTRVKLVDDEDLTQVQGVDGGTDRRQPGLSPLTLLINGQKSYKGAINDNF